MVEPRYDQRIVEMNSKQVSLYVIIILEFCTSIVAICTGANLYYHITTSCEGFRFLGTTLIFIGVTLLFLFLFTCLLARTPKLVVTKSLCGSVPLVVVLLALGIFVLAVSSRGGGDKPVPGRSYEYEVGLYSKWMQNKVSDNWDDYYKKAIVENKEKLCNKKVPHLLGAYATLKHGCCQPPEECKFNYTNPKVKVTIQENRNNFYYNNNNIIDDDCKRWDDDSNKLCFNCESCKASFLQDVTSHWFTTGIGLVLVASIPLLMGFVYVVVLVVVNGGSSNLREPLV